VTSYDFELAKTRKDIAALEAISQRDQRDLEKRTRLAYCQFHQASLTENESDFETVKQTTSSIIRDFGPKEDICLLRAKLDGRFHRLEEVKRDLQLCPTLAQRHAGRSIAADIDFQEGRYEQARFGWERLIDENRTWDTLARLAHWKGKMGAVEEADCLYREAEEELTAKEMLSFSWLELQRGALALSSGRLGEAKTHYEMASRSFSGHWHADVYMAELLAAEGDFDQAIFLLKSILVRAPKPDLKQALGEMLMWAQRREEAAPWLDAAVAAFLTSVQAGAVHYYHHLARWYADLGGRPDRAVQWARRDVALRSNFSTQSVLAWALFKNGEVGEGLEWIRLALSSGVKDGGIFAAASMLFNAAGDTAQGQYYAHVASEMNPGGHDFHLHN
jgi:tetratricopeptide (TPR) repeat protein